MNTARMAKKRWKPWHWGKRVGVTYFLLVSRRRNININPFSAGLIYNPDNCLVFGCFEIFDMKNMVVLPYTQVHLKKLNIVYIFSFQKVKPYTVPSISIGTVKTKLLCWLWSQDICKYDSKMNMRQNYRMSHFIISRFNAHVLPNKKNSTFRVYPTHWCEYKYWDSCLTGLLSDQLCPVALVLQILKAGNMSYQLYPLLLYSESCIRWWHTQTRMKMRDLTLREKQAILMLKEKRKSITALAKTKGMDQSRVWKTPATNNYRIGWENNSSWWQTNPKSCENEP